MRPRPFKRRLLVLILALPHLSLADEHSRLVISAIGCPGLRELEISRLLAIELGQAVPARGEPLRVELVCDGQQLHVAAADPITQKRLERDVDLGPPDRSQDRLVALLVSQLFLSSWSELLLAAPPASLGPRGPQLRAAPDARRLAAQRSREALAPSFAPSTWALELLAGPRVRDLETPMVDGQITARAGLALGVVMLLLGIGAERGAASREAGAVQTSIVEATVVGKVRAVRKGAFALDIEASGGPSWVDLWGSRPAAGVQTGATSGVVVEAALGVAPGIVLGAVRASLLLQAGANFSRARGYVAEGSDVSLAGPWLGASLSAELPGRTH